MAQPADGAPRAGLQVHPPPGRPGGRPRGAGRRARPPVPAQAPARQGARAVARRIRGANGDGEGHHGTVALTGHGTGAPFALLDLDDGGGGAAAVHDLLERSDIGGRVITPGALHTTRRTARLVTERADHVLAGRGNAPETLGIPGTIDWERDAAGSFAEGLDRVHGRLERRSIRVLTPPKGLASHPGVRQLARVTRYREPLKKGPDDAGGGGRDYTETVYLITSPGAEKASPEGPLAPDRGHWAVVGVLHRPVPAVGRQKLLRRRVSLAERGDPVDGCIPIF